MNWWQTLIVANLALIAAVCLIAWFALLGMCGSPWQRVVGFGGLLLMLNLGGFLSAYSKHQRPTQSHVRGASTEQSLTSEAAEGTPSSNEPNGKEP